MPSSLTFTLPSKILFDQQHRALARAQAVGINLDAVKLAQARSREPVRKVGTQNFLEQLARHERESERARPRSSDGLKFFNPLINRYCNFGIITAIAQPKLYPHRPRTQPYRSCNRSPRASGPGSLLGVQGSWARASTADVITRTPTA